MSNAATYTCSRCNGVGRLPVHSNVLGGVCFKCHGSGKQASKPAGCTGNCCQGRYCDCAPNIEFEDEPPRPVYLLERLYERHPVLMSFACIAAVYGFIVLAEYLDRGLAS